jgi:hypothetical protein
MNKWIFILLLVFINCHQNHQDEDHPDDYNNPHIMDFAKDLFIEFGLDKMNTIDKETFRNFFLKFMMNITDSAGLDVIPRMTNKLMEEVPETFNKTDLENYLSTPIIMKYYEQTVLEIEAEKRNKDDL